MKHPCVTFWPEKFFADTSHVSPPAAAFYMVLLMQAWTRGGSLPNDPRIVRIMSRASRQQWAEIRDEVMAFWFVGEDGRLHQKRLDIEWQRAEKRRPDPQPQQNQSLSEGRNNYPQKSLNKMPSRVSGLNPKMPDTLEAGKPNKNNGPPPPSRARARPLPLPQNSLPSGRESSEGKAQSNSQPAAALSVGHAAQPAPNREPLQFIRQNSPVWHLYERSTGNRLKANSIHDGHPGAWVGPWTIKF